MNNNKYWDIKRPKRKLTHDEQIVEFIKRQKLSPNRVNVPFTDYSNYDEQVCLHRNCSNCYGTGQSPLGTCVHGISCPCNACTPRLVAETGLM